jgi:TonB-linked SusC/RagA family outer membrane protein
MIIESRINIKLIKENTMKIKILLIVAIVTFFAGQSVAQQIKVTGKVTGADDGVAIPGASVIVEGTASGTVTDADGAFTLEADQNATLVISFVGYESQTVQIAGRNHIEILISPDIQTLSEVVVVGYGTQKKSDLISSVATVKPVEMMKIPSTDIGEMLRGKTPGVMVTVSNAGPGGSSDILIRGKRSISGGNAPIVIADGVPVGNINDINPNDIASVEILKDAAAQAIYGARASNGVILITTKRGKSGKTEVNYNGFYGAQTVRAYFDTYNGDEFATLKREAARTTNNGVYQPDADVFTPIELEVMGTGDYVDWQEELLRVAPIQSHNLSVTTGAEKTTVYTSLNYMSQDGVVPGTDFKKVTLRLNADQKITNWLKLGINTSFQISERNDPGTGGTLQRTVTTSPLGKIYNDDGTYRLNPTGVQESFNPLLDINSVSNLKKDRNDILNLFLDISPLKGFNYRLNASRRSWNRKSEGYSTKESLAGVRTGYGQGYIQFDDNVEYQLENIITYNTSFSKHNLGFTAVQSITESNTSNFNNNANQLPNDLLGIYGLESALINTPAIAAGRRGLVSFVGRVQYDYDGKYYLTASSRADASTVFGANNKWSQFPAVAVGWNAHKEDFFQNISTISTLKFRASYGSIGNQAITPYQSQSTASPLDYIIDGQKVSGYAPGTYLPNPSLRWETSTTFNAAVDFGIWGERLSGTVEFYNTRTEDLLVEQSLNAGLGYTKMWTNLGEIENKGIELSLNAVLVEKKDLVVNAGAQFTQNRNKIISLYGKDADGDGKEDDDTANRWFIGYPIDVYYQYKPVGIFQEGENIVGTHQPNARPGDIKLYDRFADDGVLNDKDRVITQRGPDWFGSFYADVTYKGWDLSVSLLAVQGVTRDNPYLYNYVDGGSLRGVLNGVRQNYWTPENPTGNWPRPNEANDPTYIYTMGLQDASYFRIQNITAGYSINKDLLSRLSVSKLRIYVTAQNPLTVTDFQSYSPEKNPNEYPEAISVVGGLQVGF